MAKLQQGTQMNHQPNETQPVPDLGDPLLLRAYRFFFERKPLHADPWTPEDDAAAKHPAASKLCLRCLQPNPPAPQTWFCPNCGAATGDCNNSMHFLYVFSIGEVLRRGVMGKPEEGWKGLFEKLFLVLFSFAQYNILAPPYWVWIILKEFGIPLCENTAPPPNLDSSDVKSQDSHELPPPLNPGN